MHPHLISPQGQDCQLPGDQVIRQSGDQVTRPGNQVTDDSLLAMASRCWVIFPPSGNLGCTSAW